VAVGGTGVAVSLGFGVFVGGTGVFVGGTGQGLTTALLTFIEPVPLGMENWRAIGPTVLAGTHWNCIK
jgi:hypothetical protein